MIKVFKAANSKEMGKIAARFIAEQIKKKPETVLGLPTGTSPLPVYDCLAEMCAKGELDFSKVKTANLDEYCGISPENENSYRYFMNKNLFDRVNISKANTFVPEANLPDACERYDKILDKLGKRDIQLLGIGNNGHVGFNEPAPFLSYGTCRVQLTESTIKANSRLFNDISEVPTAAVTMGIGKICEADTLIMVANGKGKHDILNQFLYGEISTRCPASLLKLHQNLIVIDATETDD